ncbi:FAD dependent oxidoreductase [Rhizobium sp. PDO1-076]|uniref:FAD/NAD(P)-binding protein n=1 Tax=Rhizobium sp. PDO1-076 TaxID=1125979 RepID=UPI00024E2CB3|nr:FAD/NAD(P)-binding protein [Rhizobium sp. PDO1-076]EHS53001.1 FAD dependent oxidoreductase [Rhizobium sp. PDO1-076]
MLKIRISSPRARTTDHMPGSRVVIVGGGYTGATVAKLLVERGFGHVEDVTVFEPRTQLGSGLAYDTSDPDVRLNVAAHRMRAVPGTPSAFLDWMQSSGTLTVDPAAVTSEGIFARRRDFGRFMHQQLAPLVEDGTIRHLHETVSTVCRVNDQWHVTGAGGTTIVADMLIVATGHPPASRPRALEKLSKPTAMRVTDAMAPDALQDICWATDILIVGSGLTALDALVRLNAQGHQGKISLLSRSGLLPRPHAGGGFSPYGNFHDETLTSARRILAKVRATISEAETHGIPWQSVFDALRQQAQSIWQRLPDAERLKLLRRLRRWYDVHRYRMPPQVSAALTEGMASGHVENLIGDLTSVRQDGRDLVARITTKSNRDFEHRCGHILLATGPDFRNYGVHQKFLLSLFREGTVQSDALGLGLVCDRGGRVISLDGSPNTSLFVAGPPARPAFGELIGVPEIAAQAANLVEVVLRTLARRNRTIFIGRQD